MRDVNVADFKEKIKLKYSREDISGKKFCAVRIIKLVWIKRFSRISYIFIQAIIYETLLKDC
jgi:hypothetical protein